MKTSSGGPNFAAVFWTYSKSFSPTFLSLSSGILGTSQDWPQKTAFPCLRVHWRAATIKKKTKWEKRDYSKIRSFLEICGKSTCMSLKVTRADMRIMLFCAQILCLSLRLVTHITKDLGKQKWLTLSSFKPDVPWPFFHDSILYAWSEFFYNVLFREFRWLCTPD